MQTLDIDPWSPEGAEEELRRAVEWLRRQAEKGVDLVRWCPERRAAAKREEGAR